jgi:hypothetical protein
MPPLPHLAEGLMHHAEGPLFDPHREVGSGECITTERQVEVLGGECSLQAGIGVMGRWS